MKKKFHHKGTKGTKKNEAEPQAGSTTRAPLFCHPFPAFFVAFVPLW